LLGYQNVYHGIKMIDTPEDWVITGQAADATFPHLAANKPGLRPRSFTRSDWDELFGTCEAATNVASLFGPELIATYPNAKIMFMPLHDRLQPRDLWLRAEAAIQACRMGQAEGFPGMMCHLSIAETDQPVFRDTWDSLQEASRIWRRTRGQGHFFTSRLEQNGSSCSMSDLEKRVTGYFSNNKPGLTESGPK
jgi:hypothetical protein